MLHVMKSNFPFCPKEIARKIIVASSHTEEKSAKKIAIGASLIKIFLYIVQTRYTAQP